MKIIPTVFSHNIKEFNKKLSRILPISKNIQIDFMDGKFVPAHSPTPKQIPNLKKYNKNFEAHLMTKNPENKIQELKKKGFKKIIFHISATKTPEDVIEKIKKANLSPWIAINPKVKLEKISTHLKEIKGVLFMGVHPGKEKQSFLPQVYKNIMELRKINKTIPIQVDGGVNEKTIKRLAKLKVTAVNSGSFISESENPRQALGKLKQAATKKS